MATIDSTPVSCPWKVYAGDRNSQDFALFATEGVPWDLTGATFKAQARASAADAAVAVEAVCTVTDPVGGLVTVEWDGEDIRTLLGGQESWSGVYDFEVTEAGAALPKTLMAGSFTAQLDVTKP